MKIFATCSHLQKFIPQLFFFPMLTLHKSLYCIVENLFHSSVAINAKVAIAGLGEIFVHQTFSDIQQLLYSILTILVHTCV